METKPGDLDGVAQTTGKAIEKEESKPTTASTSKPDPAPAVEDVPDPDEDDLDDLDGLSFLRF
jgi:peroxin-19